MWKRKLQAEALEAVKFFWKRKHFDERDWKPKRTRKHKTSRGAGSGSIKNLTVSTSLAPRVSSRDNNTINASLKQNIHFASLKQNKICPFAFICTVISTCRHGIVHELNIYVYLRFSTGSNCSPPPAGHKCKI